MILAVRKGNLLLVDYWTKRMLTHKNNAKVDRMSKQRSNRDYQTSSITAKLRQVIKLIIVQDGLVVGDINIEVEKA